jgi:hypothetical protein
VTLLVLEETSKVSKSTGKPLTHSCLKEWERTMKMIENILKIIFISFTELPWVENPLYQWLMESPVSFSFMR